MSRSRVWRARGITTNKMASALPKPSSAATVARVDAIEVFEQHGYTRLEALKYLSDRTIVDEIPGGVLIVNGERKHKCGACPKIKAVTPGGAAFIAQQLKIAIRDRRAKKKTAKSCKKTARTRQQGRPQSSPDTVLRMCLKSILESAGLETSAAAVKMFDTLAARAWEAKFMASKKINARTALHEWTSHERSFIVNFAKGN